METKRNKISGAKVWSYIFLSPYALGFITFIALPVTVAIFFSFTDFNTINVPKFIGLKNYITLFTSDTIFMQYVVPNTVKFSLLAGPIGYALSFFLAWSLAQITKTPRTVLSLIIYSPSFAAGATMNVIFKVLFSGDSNGLINAYLLRFNLVSAPVQWLLSPNHLMNVMIMVTVWSSMGVGFLAMLAGVLGVDRELYEAAYIDGVKSRAQEILHVTAPSIKPQLLFGAVMAVVGTFSAGSIGVQLSGANPTPEYSGQMVLNHIEDYGLIRYEMGYAAAVSVVLMMAIWLVSKIIFKLLGEKKIPLKLKAELKK